MSVTNNLVLPAAFDAHLHGRQGDMMNFVIPDSARWCDRVILMPNTNPALQTAEEGLRYLEGVREAGKSMRTEFNPLVYLKLVPGFTTPDIVAEARRHPAYILGFKLYCGPTTNNLGFEEVETLGPVFEAMQKHDLILSIHGETVSDPIRAREKNFLPKLEWIYTNYPRLRIVLEHLSTAAAVRAVKKAPDTVRATLTIHHLTMDEDDMLAHKGRGGHEGLNPHVYCKPVLKTEKDRDALVRAIKHPKFMLGTDSAPHMKDAKECGCCSAGAYSAYSGLPALIDLFDWSMDLPPLNKPDVLKAFTSGRATKFYGIEGKGGIVMLQRDLWTVDAVRTHGDVSVVPFNAGKEVAWRIVGQE